MKTEIIYDVDYFIKKFEAIPEELWNEGAYSNCDGTKFCALGHCRNDSEPVEMILATLFEGSGLNVAVINDANWAEGWAESFSELKIKFIKSENYFFFPTPKQRILAALYDIKLMQDSKTYSGNAISEVLEKFKPLERETDFEPVKELTNFSS